MEIIQYISLYIICGCLWALWLERFCDKHGIGGPFSNYERYYQMSTWPYSLLVFIVTWIQEIFKDE